MSDPRDPLFDPRARIAEKCDPGRIAAADRHLVSVRYSALQRASEAIRKRIAVADRPGPMPYQRTAIRTIRAPIGRGRGSSGGEAETKQITGRLLTAASDAYHYGGWAAHELPESVRAHARKLGVRVDVATVERICREVTQRPPQRR